MKYKLKKIKIGKKKEIERLLIVYEKDDSIFRFYSVANKYLKLFKGVKRKKSYKGYDYVADVIFFLNFLVSKGKNPEEFLTNVSIDDANECMLEYCNTLTRDGDYPSYQARKQKQRNFARFLINIRDAGKNKNLNDHYIRRKNADKIIDNEIIIIRTSSNPSKPVIRYCPDYFVHSFLKWSRLKKPNCWMVAMFMVFALIRPSEACNQRHPNSIYGSSVIARLKDNRVIYLELDLNKEEWERPLRSDGVPVGGIKRPRSQVVLPGKREPLYEGILDYMKMTESKEREAEGPLIIQSRRNRKTGCYMAYRYLNFIQDFKLICEKYVFPELEEMGGEPAVFVAEYRRNHYGPHMFRHGTTSELAAEGVPWFTLQEARGDSDNNPNTAAMYALKGGALKDITNEAAEMVKKQMDLKDFGLPRNL